MSSLPPGLTGASDYNAAQAPKATGKKGKSIWDRITGDVGQGWHDVNQWTSTAGNDIVNFLKSQQVPGSQIMTGPAHNETFGQLVPKLQKDVQNITGGGGKKKTPPADTKPPGAQTQQTVPAPDDVFTAGLGMFFSQYLAPMMQQINQQNTGLIDAYGQAMNQALQGPLPPGVKSIMQASQAQNMQDLQGLNQAAAVAAATTPQFNTLMNSMQMAGQGQQALSQALPALLQFMASQGNVKGISSILSQTGVQNSPLGAAILGWINSGQTGIPGLGGSTGTGSSPSSTNNTPAVQYIPVPTSTPSTSPTAQAASNTSPNIMNSTYAQALANGLAMANLPNAGQANAGAAAGYTP